jgi:hypothetical protein
MDSFKKIAENLLIKEHAWDRKFGDPLPTLEDVMNEAESMQLQPKGGGKTVVFKNKDNYEKAKKSGEYEEPEETDDDGEDKPAANVGADDAQLGGDRSADAGDDKGGEEPSDKPFGGDTGKDADFGQEPKSEPSGGQPSVDDSRQKAVQSGMALKKAEGEFGKDSSEYEAAKGADDEAQGEYQQAKASQEQRQKDINSGKAEPENKEEADLAATDARDSVEKQKQNRAYALQQPDPRDPRSPAEQEAGWDKTVADAEERAGEAEAKAKEFGAGRTGKELGKNETLKINGKVYRKVQEQKEHSKKHPLREAYERIGGK